MAVAKADSQIAPPGVGPQLNRTLGRWNLIVIGMVIIQPTAPMGIYGVISNKAVGHVVTTILIAMVAMLLTAVGFGLLAVLGVRVDPERGELRDAGVRHVVVLDIDVLQAAHSRADSSRRLAPGWAAISSRMNSRSGSVTSRPR